MLKQSVISSRCYWLFALFIMIFDKTGTRNLGDRKETVNWLWITIKYNDIITEVVSKVCLVIICIQTKVSDIVSAHISSH